MAADMTLAEKYAALIEMIENHRRQLNNVLHPNGDGPDRPALCDLVAYVQMDLKKLHQPINMVLPCPACHLLHIDAPKGEWKNPPHKSHLCAYCGTVWRPADVSTNGVERITTTGKQDNWPRYAK